jgi:hypothetical protein
LEVDYPAVAEHTNTYSEWKRLVLTYGTSGKASHDARFIAAALLAGNVQHLLTNNPAHFHRYGPKGITVLDMATL